VRILYYVTTSGRRPVREYIDALALVDRQRVLAALEDLEEAGPQGAGAGLEMKHVDGKLWELKLAGHRIFYVMVVGTSMVLLHAYKKQGQRAPLRELELAWKRMNEVLSHEA
jgi:phage-related protein